MFPTSLPLPHCRSGPLRKHLSHARAPTARQLPALPSPPLPFHANIRRLRKHRQPAYCRHHHHRRNPWAPHHARRNAQRCRACALRDTRLNRCFLSLAALLLPARSPAAAQQDQGHQFEAARRHRILAAQTLRVLDRAEADDASERPYVCGGLAVVDLPMIYSSVYPQLAMPLDNSLPDEIISEILSPALTVADEVLGSESRRLSKAQAKALACALSANVDLGCFIKKLRVEGGYGAPMLTILQRAPNVSDLYLSFEIWTPDTTDELCRGLCLINPSRFILRKVPRKGGPKNRMVSKYRWQRRSPSGTGWAFGPTVFDCSNEGNVQPRDNIVHPLVQAKRLHTVVIQSVGCAHWTNLLFQKCPLRVIQQPEQDWDVRYIQDPLKALLRYPEWKDPSAFKDNAPEFEIAPSLNSLYSPMSKAPTEVQDAIWSSLIFRDVGSGAGSRSQAK
ncbi:hypothetical protein GGX14DRAFT_618174 [Mycena pura]|uniref:Uncharacterized protein n=1 Tax=Mycena pura TaxID=153505 RepID=A0AAD6VRA9_9AGAR|nr:hypothetical protein GGX14DRAFT_618174 [Mycena pura]